VAGLSGITTIVSGGWTNYARRTDGTVWSWGYNFDGALGHGQPCAPDVACLSRVPVQVSGLTDVTAIDAGRYNGRALRADGTVWSWGANHTGQLGNGVECEPMQPCAAHVPVQTVNLTDVTRIGSFYGGGYALRANGTVWSWGSNYLGTLGTDAVPEGGSTRVPVQVRVPSGVSAIGNGPSGGYAIVP
jgi:alpha-tubulin suppressor-like RCC1 family protein